MVMLHNGADHTTIAIHDQPARKPLSGSVNRVRFKNGGSDAMFLQTPPVPGEENGHTLINTGGPLWKPSVESFLQRLKL